MNDPLPPPDKGRGKPRRRPWIGLILVGAIVIAAALGAVYLLQDRAAPTAATEDELLNYAEVVITDLVQEESFDGTLGSIEDDPVSTQLEGTITQIAEKGETVSQGEALFAIDDQPVVLLYGDTPAYRDIAIGEDTIAVSSHLDGKITWVAEPGAVIRQGDVLYRVDDQPVVVLYGEAPAYRDLDITGPDLAGQSAVAAAEAGLASAKANLAALTSPPSKYELLAAQENLASAEQALRALLDLPDPDVVRIAETNLEEARMNLQAAQSAYDKVVHLESLGMTGQAMDLWQATIDFDQAQAEYGEALEGASESDITSAQASVALAQAALDALRAGPDPDALVAAEAQVVGAQLALDATLSEASADPATAGPVAGYDVAQLKDALVALGYDLDDRRAGDDADAVDPDAYTSATRESVKTWQADIGAEVDGAVNLGEVLFLPGPAQVLEVFATPGSQVGSVLSIASGDPASGADVLQLEEALVALGFDADGALVADGVSSPETTQAVLAFQAATGLELDGILDLGEVIYLPGQVRITNQLAAKGSGAGAGSEVLGVSLSDKVVRVDLPAGQQGLLAAGDAVSVEMPDDTLVPATVVFVSQTATPSEYGPATFEVTVELDDPSVAAGLDEAPVDVVVVSDSVEDAMAIPVSALVALLEGGYAVEVDAGGGQTQLVAVEVGFFGSSNMIAIISASLEPGDRVVVP